MFYLQWLLYGLRANINRLMKTQVIRSMVCGRREVIAAGGCTSKLAFTHLRWIQANYASKPADWFVVGSCQAAASLWRWLRGLICVSCLLLRHCQTRNTLSQAGLFDVEERAAILLHERSNQATAKHSIVVGLFHLSKNVHQSRNAYSHPLPTITTKQNLHSHTRNSQQTSILRQYIVHLKAPITQRTRVDSTEYQ